MVASTSLRFGIVVEGRRIQQLDVEDTVRMFDRTNDGTMGSIDLSWSMNKEQSYYLSIYGSHGTVLVGWKDSKYRRSNDTDWVQFGEGYNKFQAFRGQIENFTRAIRGEDKLLVSPEDALASVEVIETAYDSLHHNVWQPVITSGNPSNIQHGGRKPPTQKHSLPQPGRCRSARRTCRNNNRGNCGSDCRSRYKEFRTEGVVEVLGETTCGNRNFRGDHWLHRDLQPLTEFSSGRA